MKTITRILAYFLIFTLIDYKRPPKFIFPLFTPDWFIMIVGVMIIGLLFTWDTKR